MTEQNQLVERPTTVKDYLALPTYRDRFHEVMGKRANQFMAAIVASSQLPGLKDAEPRSVIAAAMVAATLDLPVNPTLGQAHLVAYADNTGTKVAQFQIGYKGLIQLALRSGQYKRLNAGPVNGSVFKGYDLVGEPILDWTSFDTTSEVTGYFCAFETLNGFIKVVYWSRQQAESHARRFSKAYAKGYSTPWKSDFDSMATKTVIKAALGKWGLLSVEMQKAVVHDQGAQADVDADVNYVDNDDSSAADPEPIKRPPPPPRKTTGAASVTEEAKPKEQTPKAVTVDAVLEEDKKPEAVLPAETAAPKQGDPASQGTGQPQTVRPFLLENEHRTVLVEVVRAEGVICNLTNADGTKRASPSVEASVKGDYTGICYHFDSAKIVDGKKDPVPDQIWTAGNKLKLSLFGKRTKSGSIRAEVEAAELESIHAAKEMD